LEKSPTPRKNYWASAVDAIIPGRVKYGFDKGLYMVLCLAELYITGKGKEKEDCAMPETLD